MLEAKTKNWIVYKVPEKDKQYFKKVMTKWGKKIIIDIRIEPEWQTKFLHISWIPFSIDEVTTKKAEYQKHIIAKEEEEKQVETIKKKVKKRMDLIEDNKKKLEANRKKTKK